MGLHVLLNVQVDQIDPERWEGVTSRWPIRVLS
jgi:hypothetical protein